MIIRDNMASSGTVYYVVWFVIGGAATLLASTISVYAQVMPQQDEVPVVSPQPEARPGQTATSTTGQAGQRQTRDQLAVKAGIEPLARIGGRIENRAQTRIRNRIDRYYDPLANATSPFVVAGNQARTAAPRRR